MQNHLTEIGYNDHWDNLFAKCNQFNCEPMRVSACYKGEMDAIGENGEVRVRLSGKMLYESPDSAKLPVVGDWLAVREEKGTYIAEALLERNSYLKRLDNIHSREQPMAANVDIALLIQSLNHDFSINRLQRYAAVAGVTGIEMIIVLTKCDLYSDENLLDDITYSMPGIRIVMTSSVTGEGLDELRQLLPSGSTCIAFGSSGTGKSTLLNALAGKELMETGGIREDDSMGRHTTRIRKMHLLPWGALYIDTPGMREIAGGDASSAFPDIEELVAMCAFSNCSHKKEPGCAVRAAIQNGTLTEKRYENYVKLQHDSQRIDNLQKISTSRTSKAMNNRRSIHYKDAKRGKPMSEYND